MRIGEFLKLKIENIDFEERFIYIPAENTKTKKARTVWVPKEIINDIKAYIKIVRKKKGQLFNLTPRRVQQLFKKYSQKAGVKLAEFSNYLKNILRKLE